MEPIHFLLNIVKVPKQQNTSENPSNKAKVWLPFFLIQSQDNDLAITISWCVIRWRVNQIHVFQVG